MRSANTGRCSRAFLTGTLLATGLGTTACLSGPGFLKQSSGSLTHSASTVAAPVLGDNNGVLTAQIGANATTTQQISASGGSAIAGATISFPPGSVAVATNVTVQTGATLASSGFAAQIGLDQGQQVTAVSPTVVVQSSTPTDAAAQPFTVAVQLSSAQLALLLDATNYAVLYNMFYASDNTYHQGVFPASAITVHGNVASWQIAHFGAFQLVRTTAVVLAQKDIATARPIVTQAQASAAPLVLDNYTPYVVPAGKTVRIVGKNFRQTMVVALGGRPVRDLAVASDSAASFTMPSDTPYGFTDIEVQQDDVGEKHKLFAMGDKAALPLITLDPAGVCSGVKYYDANGTQQAGTMACAPAPAVSPDVMTRSVYDKGNTGIVDRASFATKASNAGQAGFALGAQGSNIVATDVIQLPADGTFFSVSNPAAMVTVTHLEGPAGSALPAGTRVTLAFTGANIGLQQSPPGASSPRLTLLHPVEVVGAGDVLEFVAVSGTNDWQEVSQVINHFDDRVTASSTSVIGGIISWTPASITKGTDFYVSGNAIYVGQSGSYLIYGQMTTSGNVSNCFPLYINSTPTNINVPPTDASPVSGVCTYPIPPTQSSGALTANAMFVITPGGGTSIDGILSFRRLP